jgi:hypothetical protein
MTGASLGDDGMAAESEQRDQAGNQRGKRMGKFYWRV